MKKNSTPKKDVALSVRITSEEKAFLVMQASTLGYDNVTDYVRELVLFGFSSYSEKKNKEKQNSEKNFYTELMFKSQHKE